MVPMVLDYPLKISILNTFYSVLNSPIIRKKIEAKSTGSTRNV
jgi:hypothetical protein